MFLHPGGVLRCAITNGAELFTPSGVVKIGVWQRVTCTYDGSTMRIYSNGAMVAQLVQTSTIPQNLSGMVIGHNNPSGENFDGAIDQLQVFGTIVDP